MYILVPAYTLCLHIWCFRNSKNQSEHKDSENTASTSLFFARYPCGCQRCERNNFETSKVTLTIDFSSQNQGKLCPLSIQRKRDILPMRQHFGNFRTHGSRLYTAANAGGASEEEFFAVFRVLIPYNDILAAQSQR